MPTRDQRWKLLDRLVILLGWATVIAAAVWAFGGPVSWRTVVALVVALTVALAAEVAHRPTDPDPGPSPDEGHGD